MEPGDASSPAGLIALLAGGLVGALVRVIIRRATSRPTPWWAEWISALALGALLAVPFAASVDHMPWITSSLGAALTTYDGVSAAYGYLQAAEQPAQRCVIRLAIATIGTTAGFAAVVFTWHAASG